MGQECHIANFPQQRMVLYGLLMLGRNLEGRKLAHILRTGNQFNSSKLDYITVTGLSKVLTQYYPLPLQ